MASQLRPDEMFVISSVADYFQASWKRGEDPPDAYLQIENEVIAVEISTLTQHVSDGIGGSTPRISEDSAAIWIANQLNEELHASVPAGLLVMLTLTTPILQARRVEARLREQITNLISNEREATIEANILDNRIEIQIANDDRPSGKKVVGIVTNAKSSPDILNNAWEILQDRIVDKSRKCRSWAFEVPKWLALLNKYQLADVEIYRQAVNSFSVDHPFEKILLISGGGSVTVLYDQTAHHGCS